MGKIENDEFSLSSTAAAEAASLDEANRRREEEERGCFCNFWFYFNKKVINFKCIFALLLGISVFISALFWLPPFLKLSDLGADKDLDPRFRGHPIVASFKLQKPVSYVKDNVLQLEADIYYELEAATAKVVIISLESSELNSTDVVFGFDHLSKHSKISSADMSLIRSNFEDFVTRQNKLLLTTSLFGEPSFFEMLKFPGGITITPQNVYPLQKVQISFNFTLNNPIFQILDNFNALVDQLKSGLHLTPHENLYIILRNPRGSTVDPRATVQTSVVLTVGVPSVPRMKQLAKTIKDSPARNLGLNNTVFGKVKQVSLSSVLPAGGASSPTPAPAPGPVPHSHHHHHHHHHHHRHDHDHDTYHPPVTAPSYPPKRAPHPVTTVSPAPWHGAPVPVKSYQGSPHASPPGCRFRFKDKHIGRSPKRSPTSVAAAPSRLSHHHSGSESPHRQAKPPISIVHQISPSSPLPNVIFSHAPPPPSGVEADPEPPDKAPSVGPLPSCAGHTMTVHWILSLVIALLLCP